MRGGPEEVLGEAIQSWGSGEEGEEERGNKGEETEGKAVIKRQRETQTQTRTGTR